MEGTSPTSKMSDNEAYTASLGDSEVVNVQHSVGEPTHELCHGPEEGIKIPPSDGRQDTGDGRGRLGFPAFAFWASMANCSIGEMGGMCLVLIASRSPL